MNRCGFSFLELVLVVLLSGIIGSGAMMSTKLVQEIRFKTLVNEVEQGIHQVQQRAVATGKQYNVYCTKEKIYFRQGNNPAFYKIQIEKGVTIPIKDYKGNTMSGKHIKFYGKMSPSKAGTIVLINQELKKKARITVRVATGKTTVYYEGI